MIYLLHFNRRYHHAGHYLGFTDNLTARLAAHRAGNGARLVEVVTAAGISFVLARVWEGDRHMERKLHRRKASPRMCPICRRAAELRRTLPALAEEDVQDAARLFIEVEAHPVPAIPGPYIDEQLRAYDNF